MRQKRELLAGLSKRLDIPREALPFGFGLTLSGQSTLTVQGCRSILTYGRDLVRLSLGKTVLSIGGDGLLCTAFEAGNITVEGQITTLCFEKGGHFDET